MIERRAPQPFFFLARNLAELSLKALNTTEAIRTPTASPSFLDSLHRQGHTLLAGGAGEDLVVAFIHDLDSYDEGGDQGRYPKPAVATHCWPECAARTRHSLREHVDGGGVVRVEGDRGGARP